MGSSADIEKAWRKTPPKQENQPLVDAMAADLIDDSGGWCVSFLLKSIHQHHLLISCQGSQNGHAVQEQLHLAGLILVHLPHVVPACRTSLSIILLEMPAVL